MVGFLGVFGHVVLDHIIRVPRLPRPNTSIGVTDRRVYFGGTAGNLARWAASVGVPTALAAFVGEDFPADYYRALQRGGVDLADLRVVRGERTPVAWIFGTRGGDQMAVVDQGAMLRATSQRPQAHTVRAARVVHLMTGQPAYYRRVAALARRLGREVALDPSQEIHYVYTAADLRALLASATYFFGNDAEVTRALRFLRLRSPRDLGERVRVLVHTHGAKGSTVHADGEVFQVPRIRPRRVVEVTGAGDAFRAGFYAGLWRGFPWRDCGVLGAAAASFAVETVGTQTNLPTWPRVLARARPHLE